MFPMVVAATLIITALAAAALLLPRARGPLSPRAGRIVEILDGRRVAVWMNGRRVEITTARGLPVSVGDLIRLRQRPTLFGITLVPVRVD